MAVFGVFAQNEGKIPEKTQKSADFAEKVPLHARARKWTIYQHFPWCKWILKMCSLPCGTLRNMEKLALLPRILAHFWWVFDISWFLWYFRGRLRYLRLVPKWPRHVFCLNKISREGMLYFILELAMVKILAYVPMASHCAVVHRSGLYGSRDGGRIRNPSSLCKDGLIL